MPEALGKIRAAIPDLAPFGIGLKRPFVEKEQLPTGKERTKAERKDEVVARRFCDDRFARHQIGVERADILVGHMREVVVGEGWIKVASLTIDAFAHGALKRSLRPGADAGVRIGCDVGRVDDAERRRQRQTACKCFLAWNGVARYAVADRRELRTLLDRGRIETIRGDLDRLYFGTPSHRGEHDGACDDNGGDDHQES